MSERALEQAKAGTPRPGREYWVYVVKLDAARLLVDRRRTVEQAQCVYVGMTSKTPAQRFSDHKAGHHDAPIVRKYGLSLRSGMTSGPYPTEREALREERRTANRLNARRGYRVWGGQGKPIRIPQPKAVRSMRSAGTAP